MTPQKIIMSQRIPSAYPKSFLFIEQIEDVKDREGYTEHVVKANKEVPCLGEEIEFAICLQCLNLLSWVLHRPQEQAVEGESCQEWSHEEGNWEKNQPSN